MSADRRAVISSAIICLQKAENSLWFLQTHYPRTSSLPVARGQPGEFEDIITEIKSVASRLSDRLFDEITGKQTSTAPPPAPSRLPIGVAPSSETSQTISNSENSGAPEIEKVYEQLRIAFPSPPLQPTKPLSEVKPIEDKPASGLVGSEATPKQQGGSSGLYSIPPSCATPGVPNQHQTLEPAPSSMTAMTQNSRRSETSSEVVNTQITTSLAPKDDGDPASALLEAAQRFVLQYQPSTTSQQAKQQYQPAKTASRPWPCYIALTHNPSARGARRNLLITAHDFCRKEGEQAYNLRTIFHDGNPAGENSGSSQAASISFKLAVVSSLSTWKQGSVQSKERQAQKWIDWSVTVSTSEKMCNKDGKSVGLRRFRYQKTDKNPKPGIPKKLQQALYAQYGDNYQSRLVCCHWQCDAAVSRGQLSEKVRSLEPGHDPEVANAMDIFQRISTNGGGVAVFMMEDGGRKVPIGPYKDL